MDTRKDNLIRKIILRVLLVLVIAIIIFLFIGYRYVKNGLAPVENESEEVVEIDIPIGSSRKQISTILNDNDLINNERIFEYYVKFNGENNFQAGTYLMSPSMSVQEIAEYLNKGDTPIMDKATARIMIPEGINLEEIAQRVDEETDFSEEEFIELMESSEFLEETAENFPELLTDVTDVAEETRYALEGYLFPATYEIEYSTTLEDFVLQMISKMDSVIQDFYDEIQEHELNVHEILTLASYIEREGNSIEDRKLISGVFYNRLEEGMPLQTDPSVSYALGEHRERVSHEDLKVDSPYNTYMYKGVGAGPINSPSEAAIEAAVFPEETDYMYFLADLKTGKIYYAKTYEEHLEYKSKYLDNNDD